MILPAVSAHERRVYTLEEIQESVVAQKTCEYKLPSCMTMANSNILEQDTMWRNVKHQILYLESRMGWCIFQAMLNRTFLFQVDSI